MRRRQTPPVETVDAYMDGYRDGWEDALQAVERPEPETAYDVAAEAQARRRAMRALD